MIKFRSKTKASAAIPTSSTADIIFLLLIFFMTVTVFKEFQGLKVQLPAAKSTKKIQSKRLITYMWVNAKNELNIDDVIINFSQIRPIMSEKMIDNPATIVSIRSDEIAKYKSIARIMEELKQANALRVNFATRSKG
jgi:biopolymer transport protein ExbD